jgi:hypothetical protein
MYIPTTTHVTPLATIRRERMLPQPGYVLVDEGDRVEAATAVARAETYGRHYLYDLPRMLDLPLQQVAKYLRVQAGAAVNKGDPLASRPTLLGLSSVAVPAPAGGAVVEIKDGQLLFAATGPVIEIKAGFPGTVLSINADWGVQLETAGALIQGAWGNGKQEYGVLKMLVNDPAQPLAVELLDAGSKGAIVVAGTTDEKGLRLAEKRKLRGLVLGSLPSGLIKAARSLSCPVLVVEGFGKRVMSQQAWSLLADNNTREAAVDARPPDRWEGRRPELIIPLTHPGGQLAQPPDGQALTVGRRVRVNRLPYAGQVGTVTLMPERGAAMPSGVLAAVAHVELEEQGTVVVPLANLEICE